MRIVLDTNILVSGLLSPYGNSAAIIRLVSSTDCTLCFDSRILSEYKEVLHRPKFQFSAEKVEIFLKHIEYCGKFVSSKPLKINLPDPDDNIFLEVAIAGNVQFLITGNLSHFPKRLCHGITIVSPADFIKIYLKIKK